MKPLLTISIVLVILSSYSQNKSDSISYTESFFGYNFYFYNQKLNPNEVSLLLQEKNEWAFDEFESAREARFFGYIFASLGSALIIYPFATAIIEHDSNWAFTYAGVGFVGLSIPIFNSYHEKTRGAIKLYNESSTAQKTSKLKTNVDLSFSGQGLALRCRF